MLQFETVVFVAIGSVLKVLVKISMKFNLGGCKSSESIESGAHSEKLFQ
jgi:hypothetical protein